MRGANLEGADLRNANLKEADLRGADLHGAELNGADLQDALLDEDWTMVVKLPFTAQNIPNQHRPLPDELHSKCMAYMAAEAGYAEYQPESEPELE